MLLLLSLPHKQKQLGHCRSYTNLRSWVADLTVEYAKPYHERLAASAGATESPLSRCWMKTSRMRRTQGNKIKQKKGSKKK
ncbi:hypothetical protein OS493_032582 [Desmophyllum pertusum]|uniref:Uncharacterized protein n=1 Tax=Desmophyllum pertusum TaxID=174260 RepID=A0A9W9YYL1_9CNID|nr:hypothetical protein OS493_032582 [Desmophyllum pertusum]